MMTLFNKQGDLVAEWDRPLNDEDMRALAMGVSPLFINAGHLKFFAPSLFGK